MDRFEYAIGLVSIIVGLGLADGAMSLHRLLKHRARVRWDWPAIGTAGFAAFTLIRMWYQLWGVRSFTGLTTLPFFISLILDVFVIFLATAAALPDESDPEPLRWDLRAYYDQHRRYIWTLLALFQTMYICHGVYFIHASNGPAPSFSYWLRFGLAPLAIMIAVIAVRSRRLQGVLVALVFSLEVLNTWNDGL